MRKLFLVLLVIFSVGFCNAQSTTAKTVDLPLSA